MDTVQINDEQMTTLVDLVVGKITAAQANATLDIDEAKVDRSTLKPEGGKVTAPTLEEITASVTAAIQANSGSQNKKVFDAMWQDKLKIATSSVHGLSEFLAGEDDYGSVRNEKLNEIEDFDKRVSALDILKKSYAEASAGQAGRKPIVNKVAQKKAEESDVAYKELERKQSAGEFTSVADMANQFMAAISTEADGLS